MREGREREEEMEEPKGGERESSSNPGGAEGEGEGEKNCNFALISLLYLIFSPPSLFPLPSSPPFPPHYHQASLSREESGTGKGEREEEKK